MLPLTIKQQKFSKLSAKMNPEIQAIQKKYKDRKDNQSMMAMNEETQAVYAKYGVSPTGSCLQLLIQMPILFALYRVIMNVPAYVNGVKDIFMQLANQIMAAPGGSAFMEELSTSGRMYIEGKDFSQVNTIVDVLYKLQDSGTATWQMLIDQFPEMEELILSTHASINHMNNFGINIANSPWNIAKSALAAGSVLMLIGAVLVPFLAALTQWLNVKMMPQPSAGDNGNDTMNATMKSMNMMMPLMSAWISFVVPAGLGVYWIISNILMAVQTYLLNKFMNPKELAEKARKEAEERREAERQAKIEAKKRARERGETDIEQALSQKEINRLKLAAARKRDAEKYGETYAEVTDDDLKS